MKKEKGVLKRMFAVPLAAVLCVGMVSNPVLTSVLAQEAGEISQGVSGNDVEPTQEETEPETTQERTEPETTVESEEETQESVSENSTAEEETQESVSENSTVEEETQESISENSAAEEGNRSIQDLVERIAALPDAEEYLAAEPDMEDGEAYVQWEEKLYEYAQEALAIWEDYEALTEEQQAQIAEEELAKLTAWVEIAEALSENTMVMAADGDHGTHSGWTALNRNTTTLTAGKNYYLNSDIEMSSVMSISGTGTVNLCLNEYQLTLGGSAYKAWLLTVPAGVTLNVYDCAGGGSLGADKDRTNREIGGIRVQGQLNVYGGSICGRSTSTSTHSGYQTDPIALAYCSGIYADSGSVVTLYGGSIEGTAASGVYVESGASLSVDGGNAKCEADFTSSNTGNIGVIAAAIYVDAGGTAEVKSGKILSSAIHGENMRDSRLLGIMVIPTGSLTVSGGEITVTGAGERSVGVEVYQDGYWITENVEGPTRIDISGGIITSVFVRGGDDEEINVTGGEITGVVSLYGGAMKLADNQQIGTASEEDYNIVLNRNRSINSDGKLILTGSLTNPASYKVKTFRTVSSLFPYIITQGFETYMQGRTPSDYFTSTDGYKVVLLNGEVALMPYVMTFDANGGACETKTGDINGGNPLQEPLPEPTMEHYNFDGWYTEETGGDKITIDAIPSGKDITVYAHWTPADYAITYDLADGALQDGDVNPETYHIETPDFTLKNPVRAGYVFTGWSGTGLEGEANQTVKVPKGSSGNRKYTAHWAVPPHSHAEISFDTVLTAGGTLNGGNYYLDSDIDGSITIKGTVNLCLNGHTLQKSGADYIVTVGSGATLNLYDCGASGNISGHQIQSRPGAVVRVTGGTFNMYGGTIKDSWIQSANGGGVYVDSGAFHMYGGTISGNKNQSGKGGGVYVNNGTFHMSGGTISGNSGYGVYIGGGPFTVSGAPKITGNSGCNVYLSSGKTITVTDTLSNTASIGVTTQVSPSDGSPVAITGTNSADYSHCFSSDTTRYEIQNSGSGSSQVVQLVLPHKHSYTYSADGAVITESCSCGHSETAALSVVSGADLTYTGSAIKACRVTYSDGWQGGTLTLNYSNHINAGTAKATISKNGETASLDFTITAKSLTDSMVSGLSPAYEWTGNAIMPSVTVKDGSKTLEEGTDYILSYAGNTNIGNHTAAVTINGVGNYTGSITKTFTIYKNWNVILHSSGGSGTDLTVYEQGTGATLPTDWTREGYIFDGWYDNESFGGEKVTEISAAAAGDKEYWAKWTDNIAPVIGTLEYSYQPKNLWNWLIGKDSLMITVPVTEEGSGADEITCTVTPEGAAAKVETAVIRNGEAEITVSADFKGTISIVCTDKAGNTSAGVTVGAGIGANGIIIEDHAPQIAFQAENAELLNTGEYRTAPDIAVTVSDDKENAISGGIASVSYTIGNGSEQTVPHDYTTGMVANDSFTIPAGGIPAGETVISVTATDNAGNSITETYTVKVHIHSGTLVPAAEPTCTAEGNREYYICSCGTWFSDSGCTAEITDKSEIEIAALGHDFVMKQDSNEHWQQCSRCSLEQARGVHVYDDASDTDCNVCGYVRTIQGHTHSAVLVPAKPPTCMKDGHEAYYTCSCGKWFSDSGCVNEITDHASVMIGKLGHDFSGQYLFDENGHWKTCRRCGAASAKHGHNYDNDRDTQCNDCGWVRVISDNEQDEQPTPTPTPEPPIPPTPTREPLVSPTPTPEPPVPPTSTPSPTEKPDDPGTVPGTPDNSQPEDKQEPESTGTPEPTEKPSGTGEERQLEGDGEQTVPASIDNEKFAISGEPVATGNVEGMTDTRTVLKLEDGAVIVTVVCAEQEYTAGVADTLAVANSVLTPEQIQLVNYGETIEIRIDVKDISDQVPEQDKETIENGIEEYRKEVPGLVLGMYVDLSMFIRIGEGDWNAITKAEEPVEIIIGIPEKLQEKGREYIIIRAHDGVPAFMDDMDDEPSTITVSTDLFSSYAIAYVQAEGTGHKCGLCHICPTFLGICCFVWLAIIIIIMIVVIILLRKKKEEQEAQDTRQ